MLLDADKTSTLLTSCLSCWWLGGTKGGYLISLLQQWMRWMPLRTDRRGSSLSPTFGTTHLPAGRRACRCGSNLDYPSINHQKHTTPCPNADLYMLYVCTYMYLHPPFPPSPPNIVTHTTALFRCDGLE